MSFKIDLQLNFSLIAEQEERIARQQALIRRLEDAGLPSGGSRALLETLEKLLNGIRARINAEGYPFDAQETRNMPRRDSSIPSPRTEFRTNDFR